MTHERVDDDGNIVATPYSAPVGTHKGRSGDDNSQWQYLVTKATGITNFHSPVWDGAVFGNHIKEQKAAGLGGFIDTDQYYGEQHCLMAEKDTRGGFDGCGHYSGESPVGYWEYEAGDVTLQQLQENMGGAGNRVVGKDYFPAKTPTQTLTLVSEALTNTAVTTFNLSEPTNLYTAQTTADFAGYTYAQTVGFYGTTMAYQAVYANTHVTQVPTPNPSAGQGVDQTTTEESDGDGNMHLTPTPLGVVDVETPGYAETYTITYSYGRQNTPIATHYFNYQRNRHQRTRVY